MFDKFRYKNKHFQIVVDGTRMMKFKERHCKHCLEEVHNKGQENEYTKYYHYVLEAKIVVGEIVISIDSEFVENEEFTRLRYIWFTNTHDSYASTEFLGRLIKKY